MLEITIPGKEIFNEDDCSFITTPGATIKLEHSLLSISKWEAKYKKSFLNTQDKSPTELFDYIKMMTVTPNVNPDVYTGLTEENVVEIKKYIEDPMTATTFSQQNQGPRNHEIITNELVYCWMTQLSIPFSCEKWHISRLLTLINVCSIKNQPPKKMDQKSILRQNAALNKARRAKKGSRG